MIARRKPLAEYSEHVVWTSAADDRRVLVEAVQGGLNLYTQVKLPCRHGVAKWRGEGYYGWLPYEAAHDLAAWLEANVARTARGVG